MAFELVLFPSYIPFFHFFPNPPFEYWYIFNLHGISYGMISKRYLMASSLLAIFVLSAISSMQVVQQAQAASTYEADITITYIDMDDLAGNSDVNPYFMYRKGTSSSGQSLAIRSIAQYSYGLGVSNVPNTLTKYTYPMPSGSSHQIYIEMWHLIGTFGCGAGNPCDDKLAAGYITFPSTTSSIYVAYGWSHSTICQVSFQNGVTFDTTWTIGNQILVDLVVRKVSGGGGGGGGGGLPQ